ncbi:MAG: DUF6754 domain-containing protein [Planctomycetota bacterium]
MQHPDAFITALLGIFAALVFFFLRRARRGHVPYVRPIPGVTAIEEAVGRATELGRPVLFVMGATDAKEIVTHAALAILGYIARLAASLRAHLIALVRMPDVFPFVESTLREAYRSAGELDAFNPRDQVRFLSQDPNVYAMGVARAVRDLPAGCTMFFGQFDYTSLLMTEPGARAGVLQIAGDHWLAQVPFFVCTCDYTIFGEEFYAAGAYVSGDPALRGAVVSQDLIKLIFALLILVGLAALWLTSFGAWLAPLVPWLAPLWPSSWWTPVECADYVARYLQGLGR